MKQPKKLTYDQKKAVSAYNLNRRDWALVSEGEVYLRIINKRTNETRFIDKYARKVKRA